MDLLGKFNRLFQVKEDCPSIDSLKIIDEIEGKRKPRNHWEYAIAQYKCQVIVYNNHFRLIVFFPIFLLLVILFNGIFLFFAVVNIFKKKPARCEQVAALLPDQDLVPFSISGEVVFLGRSGGLKPHFSFEDWWYGLSLTLRYLVYPYFVVKSLYAIYQYSGICKKYSKVLVSNEYSFCSSVITHYINRAGGLSINCMHGEKLLNARDSFCHYDIFIVWDGHYVDLFKKMKVEARFVVSYCPALTIELLSPHHKSVSYFLQGGESTDQIRHILNKLTELSINYECDNIWIKPHPLYNTQHLEELVGGNRIYDNGNSWLISNSKIVCGRYSTILFQVYVSRGRKRLPLIYIDDQLWNVPDEYIMEKKADGRFSDI